MWPNKTALSRRRFIRSSLAGDVNRFILLWAFPGPRSHFSSFCARHQSGAGQVLDARNLTEPCLMLYCASYPRFSSKKWLGASKNHRSLSESPRVRSYIANPILAQCKTRRNACVAFAAKSQIDSSPVADTTGSDTRRQLGSLTTGEQQSRQSTRKYRFSLGIYISSIRPNQPFRRRTCRRQVVVSFSRWVPV